MDKLKKYLLEIKDRLEQDEPDEKIWDQIENRIAAPAGKIVLLSVVKKFIAACIIILAGIGVYFLVRNAQSNSDKYVVTPPANNKSADVLNTDSVSVKDSTPIVFKRPPKKRVDTKIVAAQPTNEPTIKQNISKRPVRRIYGQRVPRVYDGKFMDEYLSSFTPVIENQKTIISSTPVYGVGREYFSGFIDQYRLLEQQEKLLQEKVGSGGIATELLDEMIRNLNQRIDLLILLKAEIDKVNDANKHRSSEKTYIDII